MIKIGNYNLSIKFLMINIVAVSIILCCTEINNYVVAQDEPYEIMPWRVGQFVKYQILTPENEGEDNVYKVSLVKEEAIDGKVHFWMQIDIYELVKIRRLEFKKNLTCQMLVSPIASEEFRDNPAKFISSGFSPERAVKMKIQIFDGPFVDVSPKEFFSHQEVIEDTGYSMTPEAMGKVDFSRLQFIPTKEKISVPAGDFNCIHFFVKTDVYREYYDEGIDLWRSPEVPLLGIVKMEFSKTYYWDKWSYRNEGGKIKSFPEFFSYLFNKRIDGRRRPDTHVIKLLSYGQDYQ